MLRRADIPRGADARDDERPGSGAGRALLLCSVRMRPSPPHTSAAAVRRHSPDCIPARGDTNIFALAAALTRVPAYGPRPACAGPFRTSPPAHVCTPGRWNGRVECKARAGRGDFFVRVRCPAGARRGSRGRCSLQGRPGFTFPLLGPSLTLPRRGIVGGGGPGAEVEISSRQFLRHQEYGFGWPLQ